MPKEETGRIAIEGDATTGGTVLPVNPASQAGDSVGATGSFTSPAAGSAIATIPAGSLPAGVYRVLLSYGFQGGAPVQGTDGNNMQLQKGATVISRLYLSVTSTVNPVQQEFSRVTLDGATPLTINAFALGTVGAIYTAELIATKISN